MTGELGTYVWTAVDLDAFDDQDASGKALAEVVRPSRQAAAPPAVAAPEPPAGTPAEGDAEAVRLERYTATVRDREVQRLDAMREAATPRGEGYRGPPWDDTVFSVACNLLEQANSEWSDYTVQDAYADVLRHAPTDERFTSENVNKCWTSAVNTVGDRGRPYPAARQDTASLVADWASEDDVRVDPALGVVHAVQGPPRERTSWSTLDLTAYLDGTHTPQRPELLPRADGVCLLYRGAVHSFHGESESGKSWVGLYAAAEVLRTGGSVLFLDFESDAATVVSRLLAMGAEPDAIRDRFHYVRPEVNPAAVAAAAVDWRALLDRQYELGVIDGITEALTVFGAASKDNDEVTSWIRNTPRQLAQRTGAAVVLVDHVTKDADTRGRYALGGQAKMAALDGAAYVVEVLEPLGVGMLGRLTMRVAKDRPGQVRPHCGPWRKGDRTQEAAVVVIDSREAGRTVVSVEAPRTDQTAPAAAGGGLRPTVLMERVSNRLETATQPYSRTRLAEDVHGRKEYVRAALDLLLTEGYIVADGPTVSGHPTLRLARPFREAADQVRDLGTGSDLALPVDPTRSRSRYYTGDRGTGSGSPNHPVPGPGGTESGPGLHSGPCSGCGQPCARYGLDGRPLCEPCSSPTEVAS